MKNFFFTLFVAFMINGAVNAQVFIIERGSATTLAFDNIKSAVDALQDNDKLYLPPGNIDLSSYKWERLNPSTGLMDVVLDKAVVLNKKVSVYGGGYESENATRFINGTVVVNKGASNSILTGIYFNQLSLDTLSNAYFSRCKIENTNGLALTVGTCLNNTFYECVLNKLAFENKQINFTKCLIKSTNTYWLNLSNSTLKNCIILGSIVPYRGSNGDCRYFSATFYNNIFQVSTTTITQEVDMSNDGVYDCVFKNNLWIGGHPKIMNNNTHIDEIINQSYANTFVNGDSYDYHLQPTSAGKNAGTDG
ncbi:MAG: hypothetical protein LBH32_09900, partial [Dysgonamonadaceae bacterium]|nr:hypothetical protein [Dysgonamonadaceae bacterium]